MGTTSRLPNDEAVCRVFRRSPSLQQRFQLGHPNRKSFHRDGLNTGVVQCVADEAVAVIPAIQSDIGGGGKFCFQRSPGGGALPCIGEDFPSIRVPGGGKTWPRTPRTVS